MALGQKQKARLEKLWRSPVSGFVLTVYLDTSELKRRKDQTYPVVIVSKHFKTNEVEYRTEIARAPMLNTNKVKEIYAFLQECTEAWLEDRHRYDGY